MHTIRYENFIERSVILWLREIGYETIDRLSILISESRERVSRKSFEEYRDVFDKWVRPNVLALKDDTVLCVVCFESPKQARVVKNDLYRVIGRSVVCNSYFTGQTFLAIPEWCHELDVKFLKGLLKELDVGLLTVDKQGNVKVALKTSTCKFSD